MTKTKIPRSVIITAICALVVLECAAMYNGMNGTMLAVVIAVIAGLVLGLVIETFINSN